MMMNMLRRRRAKHTKPIAGMTLVEALLYVSLLSILVTSVMAHLHALHIQNVRLLSDIRYAYEHQNP